MISVMIEEKCDISEEMKNQEENSGRARIEPEDLAEEQALRVRKD